MKELTRELKRLRTEALREGAIQTVPPSVDVTTSAASLAQLAPPPSRPKVKGAPNGAEVQSLFDAHAWFMSRLANKGQAPPPGS
jgi:hypothetical protein